MLSALSDPVRRKILKILRNNKISSGELAEQLEMSPSKLSYHLNKLKKAELIYETKHKNYIYYELNLSILDELMMWMDELKRGEEDEKV